MKLWMYTVVLMLVLLRRPIHARLLLIRRSYLLMRHAAGMCFVRACVQMKGWMAAVLTPLREIVERTSRVREDDDGGGGW